MTAQNMRYEWENQAFKKAHCVGRAWFEDNAVEAAMHFDDEALPPLGTVARADALKDILGDVEAAYEESLRALQDVMNGKRKA